MKTIYVLLLVVSSLMACAASTSLGHGMENPLSTTSPSSEQAQPENLTTDHPLAEAQPNEKANRQDIYMKYLSLQGYNAFIDEEGDICFKSEGKTYFIIIEDNNNEITTLLYPNIISVDSEQERILVAQAVSYVNRTAKIAKAYINTSDWVSISIELLLKEAQDFELLFERMMQLIMYAEYEFVNKINQIRKVYIPA